MKLLFHLYTLECRSALLTSVAGGMRMPFEATLVGYEPGTMGYRLWDTHTHSRSLRSSRDVTFDKSNSSSLWDVEPRPAPTSPAPSRAQSPHSSESSTRCT